MTVIFDEQTRGERLAAKPGRRRALVPRTPMWSFYHHRGNAKHRGIPFHLTFERTSLRQMAGIEPNLHPPCEEGPVTAWPDLGIGGHMRLEM
jgi:hypothetical protein